MIRQAAITANVTQGNLRTVLLSCPMGMIIYYLILTGKRPGV